MIAADYLRQLAALLPSGPALPREPGSTLMRLLGPPAAELARIELRGSALLAEADPRVTGEMLVDWERAFGLPDGCSPIDSFERASEATYFDGAGVLRTAAIDVPRPAFDPLTGQPTGTIIIEPGAANLIRNPRGNGEVPGSPGTLPTNYAVAGMPAGSVNRSVLASRSINGVPGSEIRVSGTASGTGNPAILFEGTAASNPILPSTTYTISAFLTLTAGDFNNITNFRLRVQTYEADGVTGAGDNLSATVFPTGTQARASFTFTTSATAQRFRASWIAASVVGAIDFTVHAAPQLELGSVATSLILPPDGAPAISTRAPDIAFTASFEERRDALLGRVTGLGGQSRAYFTAVALALGYPITIAEPRPFRCGISTVGMGLRDQEWAHCWVVYSAGEAERLFRLGASAVGDPLRSWGEGLLECVIGRLAPAHTRVLFAYGPELLLLTDEFEALGTDGGELITP